MSRLKTKLKRMLSFLTTFLLTISSLAATITPVSVYAADTLKGNVEVTTL